MVQSLVMSNSPKLEPELTETRKTLVQQQSEVSLRDPWRHAARQIRESDTFAQALMTKRKACLRQLEKDREELAYLNERIETATKRYNVLLEGLEFRRAERERAQNLLREYAKEYSAISGEVCDWTRWVRNAGSKMFKSISSLELQAARGYGSGPGSTFSRRRSGGSLSES